MIPIIKMLLNGEILLWPKSKLVKLKIYPCEKAISDYLRESGKLIKETISTRWHGLKFFEHVLLVISIPTEFDDRAKDTMRKCLYNAGLTNSKESNKIEFTTEPEAAAIYCMRNLEEQNKQNKQNKRLVPVNSSFMVVDCGGGTVDLTTPIGKIIRLIRGQLSSSNEVCNAIFLVGGFSESKYLQMRVKEEFGPPIIVPRQPIAAVVRGACDYGLKMSTIVDRTLKYTYGIKVARYRRAGDPKSQIVPEAQYLTYEFDRLVTRGTKVGVDEKFSDTYIPPDPKQKSISFPIYTTTELNAKFCNEPGMRYHGELQIKLPDVHLGKSRKIEFSLIFGKLELVAKARNVNTGKIYETIFELDF
ncbi:unnamed protein product [Rhizophagus irregularis]|nr:unnamed protein product [Rhizophagus irregularis]